MRKTLLSIITIFPLSIGVVAQAQKDSANIQEVVITGQYSQQSIKKSLYKVEVITNEDLQRMAANNVAEVLNQTLNILIIPDKNSGDSKANILGMGADYTKVLIDNIPVIGDTGLGSNIDLTKINLDNIERIEIVKGSMGVEFGNNAVSGVINIITKKSSRNKWNVRGSIQEETVRKEQDHLARLMRIVVVTTGATGYGAGVGAFKTALQLLGVFDSNRMPEPVQALEGDNIAAIKDVLASCGML